MLDALGTIADVFGAIGDFISSIIDMISYLFSFIYSCINESTELLAVIPGFVSTVIISAVVFMIVIACKRAVID